MKLSIVLGGILLSSTMLIDDTFAQRRPGANRNRQPPVTRRRTPPPTTRRRTPPPVSIRRNPRRLRTSPEVVTRVRRYIPYRYTRRTYTRYYHRPHLNIPRHDRIRWNLREHAYYRNILRLNRNYIFRNWIYIPSTRANDYYYDDYPYYVHNGYRHRYSNNDQCNYQLIDTRNYQVIESYWGMSCQRGYDLCSAQRDDLNYYERDYRYDCAETFRDQGYDYNRTYEDDYYDDRY